ncbi:MAG TPA: hypothetical protein VHC22_10485 [Pirellulales bacterium]|nr:hypothetical protein [Pirellulales bacterium]
MAESGLAGTDLQPVAMDGKALCGALGEHGQLIHLLSLLDQRTGFWISGPASFLRQAEVSGKTNGHKTALELLKTLVLKGRLITGDAMFCQRDWLQLAFRWREAIECQGDALGVLAEKKAASGVGWKG